MIGAGPQRGSGRIFGLRRDRQIRLDPGRREVWKGKFRIEVTSIEFDILDILMHTAGHVVSRDQLAADLSRGEVTASRRFIDVHISHLRKN